MKLGREARIGQSTCIGAGTVIEDGAEVSCTSSGSRPHVNSQPPSPSMSATYLLYVVQQARTSWALQIGDLWVLKALSCEQ